MVGIWSKVKIWCLPAIVEYAIGSGLDDSLKKKGIDYFPFGSCKLLFKRTHPSEIWEVAITTEKMVVERAVVEFLFVEKAVVELLFAELSWRKRFCVPRFEVWAKVHVSWDKDCNAWERIIEVRFWFIGGERLKSLGAVGVDLGWIVGKGKRGGCLIVILSLVRLLWASYIFNSEPKGKYQTKEESS